VKPQYARRSPVGGACYGPPVKISVVIPALDEADQIDAAIGNARKDACQAAATGDSGSPHEIEIIVVDGGSEDTTVERAEAAHAHVIATGRGRARQLGEGARASHGSVLLFLHADTRLPRGWADAIAAALEDPNVVGGAFGFRFDRRDSWALRLVEGGARLRARWLGLPYGDQALFVRRATLEALGGIPQTPIMEDLDLVQAMKRYGRLALLPLDAVTSSRRHRAGGVLRTAVRHALAAFAWGLGADRERIAAWVRR